MVTDCLIVKYWRLYRENRRLFRVLKRFCEQNQTAWEVGSANVRELRRRNAELKVQLEESRKQTEELGMKVLAQKFLLKRGLT